MKLDRRLFSFAFSVCLVAFIMLKINPLYAPPGIDSGVFLYIGSQILKGKLPYLDVWDHKGPLIYYIDALGLWISHGSVRGIWLMEFALLTCAFFIGIEMVYRFGGMLPAITGSLIGYHFFNQAVLGNMTEEYYFFFAWLAIGLYLSKPNNNNVNFTAIGIVSALGFLLRPNNIGVPVTIVLSTLIMEIRQGRSADFKRQFLFFLSGLIGVLLITGIYFWLNNALADLVDQAFVYNIVYSNYYRSNYFAFVPQDTLLFWMSIIGYAAVLGAVIFMPSAKTIDSKIALLVIIGLPLEVFLVNISGRGLAHYSINLLPYIILLIGYITAVLFKMVLLKMNNMPDFALSFGLALLFLFANYESVYEYYYIAEQIVNHRAGEIKKVPMVDRYIKANTSTDDKVLVWGHGGSINFVSKRDAPTRYMYQIGALFTPGYTTQKIAEDFLNDLSNDPPELVVVFDYDLTSPFLSDTERTYKGYLPPMYKEISSFFQTNYHLEAELLKRDTNRIYRLNSSIVPQ